jgi:hypothetical protein
MSLQFNPNQTVERLCATTGVANIYQMKANLRTLRAMNLIVSSDDLPTTYNVAAEVSHV